MIDPTKYAVIEDAGLEIAAASQLQAVFTAIDRSQGRIEFRADRTIVDVNDNYLSLMGYTRDEVVGNPHSMFVSDEHGESEEYEAFWQVLLSGDFHRGEFQRLARDGSPRWIQATYNPIQDGYGAVHRIIKYAIDVTPQKLAERDRERLFTEVRQGKTLLDGILSTAPDAVIVIDTAGTVVKANRSAEIALDVDLDGLLGRSIEDFMPRDVAAKHGGYVSNALHHRSPGPLQTARRVQCQRSDGSRFEAELSVSKVEVAGKVLFTGVLRDVTERVELQSMLHRAEKMESIGRLAAGIGHEINTPLQFIGSNVSFVSRKHREWAELHRAAEDVVRSTPGERDEPIDRLRASLLSDATRQDIEEAFSDCKLGIDRVAEIVGAMKEFAHPGCDDGEPFDINQCLRNAAVITNNATKQHATVQLDLDPDNPLVEGSASSMNQTLVNLIVNAAHAIEEVQAERPGKGSITVASRRAGNRVVVRVTDTGCGMPQDVAAKAFEPFFTTKEVGKGTGQGLAIAYKAVVDMCGGTIRVESEAGQGSSLTIELNAVSAPLSRSIDAVNATSIASSTSPVL
ncbi:MAG: PAS domain S-box protein [Planctomycetota bacterium]